VATESGIGGGQMKSLALAAGLRFSGAGFRSGLLGLIAPTRTPGRAGGERRKCDGNEPDEVRLVRKKPFGQKQSMMMSFSGDGRVLAVAGEVAFGADYCRAP